LRQRETPCFYPLSARIDLFDMSHLVQVTQAIKDRYLLMVFSSSSSTLDHKSVSEQALYYRGTRTMPIGETVERSRLTPIKFWCSLFKFGYDRKLDAPFLEGFDPDTMCNCVSSEPISVCGMCLTHKFQVPKAPDVKSLTLSPAPAQQAAALATSISSAAPMVKAAHQADTKMALPVTNGRCTIAYQPLRKRAHLFDGNVARIIASSSSDVKSATSMPDLVVIWPYRSEGGDAGVHVTMMGRENSLSLQEIIDEKTQKKTKSTLGELMNALGHDEERSVVFTKQQTRRSICVLFLGFSPHAASRQFEESKVEDVCKRWGYGDVELYYSRPDTRFDAIATVVESLRYIALRRPDPRICMNLVSTLANAYGFVEIEADDDGGELSSDSAALHWKDELVPTMESYSPPSGTSAPIIDAPS
jgi:hypothetical protein